MKEKKTIKGYKRTEIGIIPEDWEVKKLGEIGRLKYGESRKLNPDRKKIYPIIGTGGILGYGEKYIYNKPTIIIGRKGTIDKPIYIEQSFWCVDTTFYIEFNEEVNPKFIFYKSQLINWLDYNEASGVPSLNSKTIENIKISFPPLPEQQVIARVLSDFDLLIKSLDKLIEKKKLIKKGAMQQLLTGKKRLPGFTGEWVKKKLRGMVKIRGGYSFKSEYFSRIGIPVIRISNIINERVSFNDIVFYPSNIKISEDFVIRYGDILIAMSGATTGKIGLYNYKIIAYQNQRVGNFEIVDKSKIDKKYLYFLSKSYMFQRQLYKDLEQGAQPNISGSQIENIQLLLPPTLAEQQAIAQILSDMDAEIESLEKKKQKYEKMKKGAMELLLTGKIRLKNNMKEVLA